MTLELTDDDVKFLGEHIDLVNGAIREDSEADDRLLRIANHYLARALRDRAALLARVRELEAALPRTADGVAVVPGMEVWVDILGTGTAIEKMRARQLPMEFDGKTQCIQLHHKLEDGYWRDTSFPATRVYSTEAAAEAAKR